MRIGQQRKATAKCFQFFREKTLKKGSRKHTRTQANGSLEKNAGKMPKKTLKHSEN